MSGMTVIPASTSTLRQLVRERLELSEAADPHGVVSALIEELPPELLEQAARKGLAEVAMEVVRAEHYRVNGNGNHSARWDNAQAAAMERPDIFARRVCVGVADGQGIWKFLGECTKGDLDGAAELKSRQAAGLERAADRLGKLANQLARSKATVVRELDRAKVETILDA